MKKSSKTQRLGLICTFLVMGAFISACDSSGVEDGDFETSEVQDLYTTVSSELSLSASQQSRFKNALQKQDHRNREPGYLWIVADSLSDTLTDEQIETLLNRTDSFEGFHPFAGLRGSPGGGGYYGLGGLRGAMGHRGESGSDDVLGLTEDQQQELKRIHEAFRTELKGLKERRRAGELEDGDFLRERNELHNRLRVALGDVLTDEQKAAIEQFKGDKEAEFEAFRETVRLVRNDVLGLTPEQVEAFDGFIEDQMNMREVLMEQFEAGELTREELKEEVDALRAAHIASLQSLLSADSVPVVQIHAALVVRVGMRGHQGRPGGGGPGGGGPPGQGRRGQ